MRISLITAIGIIPTEGHLELQVPLHEYQFNHPNHLIKDGKRSPKAYVNIPISNESDKETRISVSTAFGVDIAHILQANKSNDENHQIHIPSLEVKKMTLNLQEGTIQFYYRFLRNDEVEESYSIKDGSTCAGNVYRVWNSPNNGLTVGAIPKGFVIYW